MLIDICTRKRGTLAAESTDAICITRSTLNLKDVIVGEHEIPIDQLGRMSRVTLYQPPKERFHPTDDEDH